MQLLPKDAVLIVIDVQKGFDDPKWGARNNPQAEENIARLLKVWRELKRPIVHVQHLSTNSESPLHSNCEGSQFKELVAPQINEPVIQKHVNSAFIETNLEQMLRESKCQTLVITGLTTPHCVSTTTRMAGNLGFQVFLVSDATAAFEIKGHNGKTYPPEVVHEISLATLSDEFATIVETATLLKTT